MDVELLEQTPLSLALMKAKLEALKNNNKELNFRAAKVYEYLNETTPLDPTQAQDYKKKLLELAIPRIREKHLDKILDIMPETVEEIKALLVGENITVKNEDLQKILSVIKG